MAIPPLNCNLFEEFWAGAGVQSLELDWLACLRQERAIAVLRVSEIETGRRLAAAVAAAGMRLLEVTWNSTEPAELVRQLGQDLPGCVIGAGTLLTVADVEAAIAAGARFLFTPHTALPLIDAARAAQVPLVAGALTPTEIVTAWQAGASCVKVFPIQSVGGASYLRALRDPLGNIPLIPTGGITLDNASSFLEAGAIAVGLAGQLFPQEAIGRGDWAAITERARRLRVAVQPHLAEAEGFTREPIPLHWKT